MGWAVSPQPPHPTPPHRHRYVEILTLGPVSVALFGNLICADVIDWRWCHTGLGLALNSVTNVLIRRDLKTQGRGPCEDGDRVWSYATTSQGKPSTAGNHPRLKESRNNSSLGLLEGKWPYQHHGFGFPASRIVREYISVVLSHPVCGGVL